MLQLFKIQNTIFFLILGFYVSAQEMVLVKTIPFLTEGESVYHFRSDFLRVGVKGKAIRLFKPNGELLTPVVYDDIKVNGLNQLRLIKGGKYGFIDYEGNEVGSFDYDDIKPWKCGCSIARRGENHYVIDTLGNELLLEFDINFDKAEIVATNGLIGYGQIETAVAENGVKTTRTIYRYIKFDFQKGVAEKLEGIIAFYPISQNDFKCKYGGYIESFIFPNVKEGLINAYGEITVAAQENFEFKRVGDSIYFINVNGTFVLDNFGNVNHLLDDRVNFAGWNRGSLPSHFVWTKKSENGGLIYGIINNHFQKITPAKYDWLGTNGDGLFQHADNSKGELELLNKDGEKVLKGDYLKVRIVRDVGIFAKIDSLYYEWFDQKGNKVVPFKFFSPDNSLWATRSRDYKLVAVKIEESHDYIIYDNDKEQLWEGNYDAVRFLDEESLIIVSKDEKYGALNFDGNFVVDLTYDFIYEREIFRYTNEGAEIVKGLIAQNKGEQWFYDLNGERKFKIDVIPKMSKVRGEYYWVKSEDDWEIYKTKR